MMTVMVKTISTLYDANHHNGLTARSIFPLPSLLSPLSSPLSPFPLVAFGPHLDENRPEREKRERSCRRIPKFLGGGVNSTSFPLDGPADVDGSTDSSFSVDSSVILNQVYTFAATA